ncbi:MAG: hypothetical protein ABR507_04430 [Actinomycetota bacterium]|nr:hypothetical protein [Actinomycetota bacterium]
MPTAFWVCAAVTAVSAFVSLGYSLASLIGSDTSASASPMYAAARSIALATAATVALFASSNAYLEAIALTMVIVQAADSVVGAIIHDRLKTIGPGLTSVANAVALVWLYASN